MRLSFLCKAVQCVREVRDERGRGGRWRYGQIITGLLLFPHVINIQLITQTKKNSFHKNKFINNTVRLSVELLLVSRCVSRAIELG